MLQSASQKAHAVHRERTPPASRRRWSPPTSRAPSVSPREQVKFSTEMQHRLFEADLEAPSSEKWVLELHRRSETYGCIDSRALERALADSPDTQPRNRLSREEAILNLTRGFEQHGLRDEWLAHAISLFDRARAAVATGAEEVPKSSRKNKEVELLAASLMALKQSTMEAEYEQGARDVIVKLACGKVDDANKADKAFMDVFRKELVMMQVLDYRVAVPTSFDIAIWLAHGACLCASGSGATGSSGTSGDSDGSDWAGLEETRFFPTPHVRCSGAKAAAMRTQPRMVLLAGFLVELAVAHLPPCETYGPAGGDENGCRQPPAVLAFTAVELALNAFGLVPSACKEFLDQQRHALLPQHDSSLMRLKAALVKLWAQPPDRSEVCAKWRRRELQQGGTGGSLLAAAPRLENPPPLLSPVREPAVQTPKRCNSCPDTPPPRCLPSANLEFSRTPLSRDAGTRTSGEQWCLSPAYVPKPSPPRPSKKRPEESLEALESSEAASSSAGVQLHLVEASSVHIASSSSTAVVSVPQTTNSSSFCEPATPNTQVTIEANASTISAKLPVKHQKPNRNMKLCEGDLWKQFTPDNIDYGRCLARTWSNGCGNQCTHLPLQNKSVCRLHEKNSKFGMVDGPIPDAPLREFVQARKRESARTDDPRLKPTRTKFPAPRQQRRGPASQQQRCKWSEWLRRWRTRQYLSPASAWKPSPRQNRHRLEAVAQEPKQEAAIGTIVPAPPPASAVFDAPSSSCEPASMKKLDSASEPRIDASCQSEQLSTNIADAEPSCEDQVHARRKNEPYNTPKRPRISECGSVARTVDSQSPAMENTDDATRLCCASPHEQLETEQRQPHIQQQVDTRCLSPTPSKRKTRTSPSVPNSSTGSAAASCQRPSELDDQPAGACEAPAVQDFSPSRTLVAAGNELSSAAVGGFDDQVKEEENGDEAWILRERLKRPAMQDGVEPVWKKLARALSLYGAPTSIAPWQDKMQHQPSADHASVPLSFEGNAPAVTATVLPVAARIGKRAERSQGGCGQKRKARAVLDPEQLHTGQRSALDELEPKRTRAASTRAKHRLKIVNVDVPFVANNAVNYAMSEAEVCGGVDFNVKKRR